MKINELKEGFEDWAIRSLSPGSSPSSVAAGSAKVKNIFIKDFIEDFREGLDSAIKSGVVTLGSRQIPKAQAGDFFTEDKFQKLNTVFESIMDLMENEDAQTVSEWGLEWWQQYMQAYQFDRVLPQVKRILQTMEQAYSQQGMLNKMKGTVQFNNALNQLANLAWSVERTGKRRPGPTGSPGPGGPGGTSPDQSNKREQYLNSLAQYLLKVNDPEQALPQALSKLPPMVRQSILASLEGRLRMMSVPANDDAYIAIANAQKQLLENESE
jgi:hypothetical protein